MRRGDDPRPARKRPCWLCGRSAYGTHGSCLLMLRRIKEAHAADVADTATGKGERERKVEELRERAAREEDLFGGE